jgi:hypothetical protein
MYTVGLDVDKRTSSLLYLLLLLLLILNVLLKKKIKPFLYFSCTQNANTLHASVLGSTTKLYYRRSGQTSFINNVSSPYGLILRYFSSTPNLYGKSPLTTKDSQLMSKFSKEYKEKNPVPIFNEFDKIQAEKSTDLALAFKFNLKDLEQRKSDLFKRFEDLHKIFKDYHRLKNEELIKRLNESRLNQNQEPLSSAMRTYILNDRPDEDRVRMTSMEAEFKQFSMFPSKIYFLFRQSLDRHSQAIGWINTDPRKNIDKGKPNTINKSLFEKNELTVTHSSSSSNSSIINSLIQNTNVKEKEINVSLKRSNESGESSTSKEYKRPNKGSLDYILNKDDTPAGSKGKGPANPYVAKSMLSIEESNINVLDLLFIDQFYGFENPLYILLRIFAILFISIIYFLYPYYLIYLVHLDKKVICYIKATWKSNTKKIIKYYYRFRISPYNKKRYLDKNINNHNNNNNNNNNNNISKMCSRKILLCAGNSCFGGFPYWGLILNPRSGTINRLYSNIARQFAGNLVYLEPKAMAFSQNTFNKNKELLPICEHLPKINYLNEDEFGYFLAGMLESKGEFLDGYFNIYLAKDCKPLAYAIKKRIGYGIILEKKNQNTVKYICRHSKGVSLILNLINGKLIDNCIYNKIIYYKYNKKYNIQILRPLNKLSLDNYWLAGFTQSNGSFSIKIMKSKNFKLGYTVRLEYCLEKNDKYLLYLIYNVLNAGFLLKNPEKIWIYKSAGYKLAHTLINYFDKFHLFGLKYVQYMKFRKVYLRITEGKHLEKKILLKIKSIATKGASEANTQEILY